MNRDKIDKQSILSPQYSWIEELYGTIDIEALRWQSDIDAMRSAVSSRPCVPDIQPMIANTNPAQGRMTPDYDRIIDEETATRARFIKYGLVKDTPRARL